MDVHGLNVLIVFTLALYLLIYLYLFLLWFQTGQSVTSVDILGTVKEPVLPIIDHPTLLPLVQDYVQQKKQQQQQQSQSETSLENAVATATSLVTSQQAPPSISNEDDEFDEFVSGPSQSTISVQSFSATSTAVFSAGQMNTTEQVIIGNKGNMVAQAGMGMTGLAQPPLTTAVCQKPVPTSVEKIKRMNLPKVGFSPELSPSTSFDHTCDDEFDDFQSAPIPTLASTYAQVTPVPSGASTTANVPQIVSPVFSATFEQDTQPSASVSSVESSQVPPAILQPEKPDNTGDKYAVFRELETPSEESSQLSLSVVSADESFGEFCSSEPLSLSAPQAGLPPTLPQTNPGTGMDNASPVSFEIYSTPPETITENNVDNYFEADFSRAFTVTSTQSIDNYADIHEAMKRAEAEQKKNEANEWSDPFGEFEEAPNVAVSGNTSAFSSTVPQFNVSYICSLCTVYSN